jgi:hypothetical protein
MALERPPGVIRFMFRIKMQHHPCDFTPVSTFHIRIEQAQIRDEMFFVASRNTEPEGANIRDEMPSYSSTRSASSPRGPPHNTFKPAQRRDEIGANIAIVARKHRGDASIPAGKATHLRRRVARTLTVQELLAAEAGHLMRA